MPNGAIISVVGWGAIKNCAQARMEILFVKIVAVAT
jgi:hypothetical protein